MGDLPERFCYVYSCDLDVNVQLKIGTLEGKRDRPGYKQLVNDPLLRFSGACKDSCSDLYVTCQVYADGKPLTLPVRTAYKAFSTRWNWNEWLTLPVKYSDLPRNALACFTIWDIYGPRNAIPVGGTTMPLFGKHGTFRQGMHDLKVWPDLEADGHVGSTTPGKIDGSKDEMSRLAKLSIKHKDGHMLKVDWLDRLTFREIEMINEKQKRDSNFMYLMVEFPLIHYEGTEFAVVYFEKGGDEILPVRTNADIVSVPDAEISLENLVESKHHKLARSLRTDRDLKPNAGNRDQLNTILGYPPTKTLTSEEQDLLWKFRFYLSEKKKALTKFLKCVKWDIPQEVKQALDLMQKWSPIDPEDALELLCPAFTYPAVRKYAVSRLQQADDEDLLLYLLQLVQALKYENFEEIRAGQETSPSNRQVSGSVLGESAMSTKTSHIQGDHTGGRTSRSASTTSNAPIMSPGESGSPDDIMEAIKAASVDENRLEDQMDLATFLISRASKNFKLANYLYWYLVVECDDQDNSASKDEKIKSMYITVLKRFSQALMRLGPEYRLMRSMIASQKTFQDKLVQLVKMVTRESGSRTKKIEKLQALLTDHETFKFNFAGFDPIPLPLDPEVKIKALLPDKATLFKSQLMPCKLAFKTVEETEYIAMFKLGDDLRQDQLVLQMISLMDKLLRQENLDLKLTPYKVLATSCKNGFVQIVESTNVAVVLSSEGSIQNFLRKYSPFETGPYGIRNEVMDNYVKSCAGYCVLTYLLGVGDRHLDNLLITKSGKMFHIDFGYILGRDPKPFPPPMKLSKEMVEAMGGTSSKQFEDFRTLCYTSFLHLRRSANLILNLFSLMIHANVPDIALEPDKTVKKVQDKFKLELSDEEAVRHLQNEIDVSVSAFMAGIVEQFHKMAQYWRK
ncbi:phosphatidylinositol 3-kinase catalytic subunit type 3 [Lingula anatina]|uniref:Phosphatidylinositol 3-kinase catalytic subunit type 3 n=1 Tax=Lingula anatina TaxID=7574 RepID=A0A1S3J4R7_LINAN|nr:phosphatidylinositol 3-kinase catalytic subunit type 3 [Lingula anatina]|eukprot:XP_013404834.1 phosphatidylinositol 3-kinase catalytic subunit type 3 [Lingula anatina]